MEPDAYDVGLVRCWSNLTVYAEVARAGPHRADGYVVLVMVDRIHRALGLGEGDVPPPSDLTTPPDTDLTEGG